MRIYLCGLSLFAAAAFFSTPVRAGGFGLRLGPPSVGSGGPNPLSIPPSGGDLGLTYVTDKGTEFNASIISLSVARRTKVKAGFYMSLGGGLAISTNGVGFGPYAAFGYESACSWFVCLTAEYQQAVGMGLGSFVTPSALRIGAIKWF